MQTYTITKIYRSTKDKQGNELKTKDGRSYERVAIKTAETGDKYVSGFGADWNKHWEIGEKIQIIVEQKGEYLNFSKIIENDLLELRVASLEKEVKALRAFLVVPATENPPEDIDYPEANPSEIPFN